MVAPQAISRPARLCRVTAPIFIPIAVRCPSMVSEGFSPVHSRGIQLPLRRPFWQTAALVGISLLLHYVALRGFLSVNSTLDPRVLGSLKPFQVELIAEPATKPSPPETRASPPTRTQAPRVVRPRPAPAAKSTQSTVPTAQATPAASTDAANVEPQVDEARPGANVVEPGPDSHSASSVADARVAQEPVQAAAEDIAPSPAPAFGEPLPPPPPSGQWSYSIHMGQYDETGAAATLRLGLRHDGVRYQVSVEANAVGLTAFFYSGVRRDLSEGRISANGFEPFRYAEQRNRRAERAATIDYHSRRIEFADGRSAPLPQAAQDRLSGLFQLGLLARGKPEWFAHGQTVVIDEFSLRSVERVGYRVDGVVLLPTHLGSLRTLQLTRQPVGNSDEPIIEVWLDYDFWMLPVRIRLTHPDGRVIDQLIDKRG